MDAFSRIGHPMSRTSEARPSMPNKAGEIVRNATVFFDLDGTIVDQRHMRSCALRKVVDEYLPGFDDRQVTDLHDQILENIVSLQSSGSLNIHDAGILRFERLCAALGRPASRALVSQLYREYRIEHQHAMREVAGASEVLMGLRRSGVRLGIISNGYTEEQLGKLKALRLLDMFDVIVISEAIGAWKPQPAIFMAAAHLAGAEPAQCVMVGDSVANDINGGLAAGFRCIFVAPCSEARVPSGVLHLNGFVPASKAIDQLLRPCTLDGQMLQK
ncbi:HAD family hydrolase [Paraburkholderia domus]|uniref:HAD family hydrolase n=1 Tax=Paraburkholderia domus TaxID=2793075 RepID=UPI001B108D5A|nr:HAD-IA family hydrolase [Paraburkholderia domus]CAE6851507.1 Phosphoglycolate phosphatase [Paraburkholderia domus]